MTQLERLLEWYQKSVVVTNSITVPLNTRIELCVNNPNRIFLMLNNQLNAGPFAWIPEGKFCNGNINFTGANTGLLTLSLELEKNFQLVTSGWAIFQTGGGTIVDVIEVLYQG